MKLSRLLRLVATRPGAYLRLLSLWVAARLAIIAVGLLLQAIFDRLTTHPATLTITMLLVIVGIVEMLKAQLWYSTIMARIEPRFTFGMRGHLRTEALARLMRRPAGVGLSRPAGDVLSRFGTDVNDASVFVIWSASNVARLIIALAALGIMLSISWVVTLGVVVPVLIVIGLGRGLTSRVARYQSAARDAAAEVSTLIGETLAGVQAVKVARAEHRLVTRMRAIGRDRARVTVRELVLSAAQEAMFDSAATIGVGLLLLTAAREMRAGSFTVGDLALFVFYLDFLSEASWALGMLIVRSRKADLALRRLEEVSEPEITPVTAGPAPAGEVRLENVSYYHPSSGSGISEVSVSIPAGSVTVIAGTVGAGKTTLLQVVAGLLPAAGGALHRGGTVAYTAQAPVLFSGTVRENVTLGLGSDDEAVSSAISRAAIDLDPATVIGARGLRLSGGQVKRVAAARMLLRAPDLLLIDDLDAGLDSATAGRVWQQILASRRGTVIAVSHSRSVLRQADQVIVLDGGRVLAAGTYDEVKDAGELVTAVG